MKQTFEMYIYRHTPNIEGDRNIIGALHFEDDFFCHTLEDEKRPDGEKVYGKTCIAPGRYRVLLTMSNRFKRVMPLLVDVPMFEGVRLHGGNTSEDSHGCPLIAFNTDYQKIWGTAERAMTKKLKEVEMEGKEIYITIKDSFLSYDRELKRETI